MMAIFRTERRTSSGARRWVAMRVAGSIAAICAIGMAPLPAGPVLAAPAALPSCQTAQLSISVEATDNATGHVADQFRIHNRSFAACTLFGFPGAQLLDAGYRPVFTRVVWGPGYGARPRRLVTLAPRGNAYVVLDWVHFSATGGSCATTPYLLITPPNTRFTLTVTDAIDACGGRLTASPVEPTPFF